MLNVEHNQVNTEIPKQLRAENRSQYVGDLGRLLSYQQVNLSITEVLHDRNLWHYKIGVF